MRRGIKLKLRFLQSSFSDLRNEHTEWLLFLFQFQVVQDHSQENATPSSGVGRINQPLSTWDHLSPQQVCTAESMWLMLVNPRSSPTHAAHLPPNSGVCLMELRVRLTTAVCGEDGEEGVVMERMVSINAAQNLDFI